MKTKSTKQRKTASSLKYKDREWLIEAMQNGLSYQQIARECTVSENTVAKWLVELKMIPIIPSDIIDKTTKKAVELKDKYGCKFIHEPIVILGVPVVKKNSNTTFNGMRLPNKRYAPYAFYNTFYLEKTNKHKTIDTDIILTFMFYRNDKRINDISNLYEAPQDIMVRAGILSDDNDKIVKGHDGSRIIRDKNETPRTVIYFWKD